MQEQERIRVLVVHDEHLVDAGLTATLGTAAGCEVVAPPRPAARGAALPRWLAQRQVDIVITDYEQGLRLAEALRLAPPAPGAGAPRTMIVTARATQAEIRGALRQGVAGYLAAASSRSEIVDAVRKVHLGMRHVSEPLAHRLLEDLLGEALTPRECEVLRLAAEGCANKVIAARLNVELGTVKCHMKAVMDKLQAANRTEAVVIAGRRGLLALQRARSGAGDAPAFRPPFKDRARAPAPLRCAAEPASFS